MESNLGILEVKVREAVGLIKELRAENSRLVEMCEDLEVRCTELTETNGRLKHDLEGVREQAQSVEEYEEKRKAIEDKVGGLLQQLEALG